MGCAIEGVLPVLQTPLTDDDQVDWELLAAEIEWAIDAGAAGICAAMVSEWLRLSPDERVEYMHVMARTAAGRVAVVPSVGAESTREAVEYARQAEQAGCQAVMAIPPVSQVLPESQLLLYFSHIARATELPLIVQDASSYVGTALSIDLMAQLLDQFGEEKILFKPEAAPLGSNLSALRDATGGRAHIFDGSGGILLIDAYRRGISGTIPAVDLLDAIVAIWQALHDGDDHRAYSIYFPVSALVALQMQAGLDGFLAVEKYILVRRGLFRSERRRAPVSWEMDAETRREVDRLYELMQASLAEIVRELSSHCGKGQRKR